MTKLEWVKWYPEKFLNGIRGMPADQIGVYTLVLNLIYDNGGPIKDDRPKLARLCYMRPTSFDKVLMALADDGKLIVWAGTISNPRAEQELETLTKVVEKWKNNFAGSDVKVGGKSSKNNDGNLPLGDAGAGPNRAVDKESVEKKERKKDSTSPRKATLNGVDYSEEFESLWKAYPRTRGTSKHKAYQLWQMLNSTNQQRVKSAIPQYAAQMKSEGRPEEKIKHLQFFISERVYETFAVVSTESNVVALEWYKTATREQWVQALRTYERDSNWRIAWGPKPGYPGCSVPQDLVAALPYHLNPENDPHLKSRVSPAGS